MWSSGGHGGGHGGTAPAFSFSLLSDVRATKNESSVQMTFCPFGSFSALNGNNHTCLRGWLPPYRIDGGISTPELQTIKGFFSYHHLSFLLRNSDLPYGLSLSIMWTCRRLLIGHYADSRC